ncbi:unnamed protein product [Caenorhabditis angaria]|uniref:Acyltransferase 3 domain-containing protein n=1 Tax=Caenorhabditis angaria TaxID=860376 RepID=A0A9P1I8I5_9PELO|nr:unnamed protein product [Caenorhabditis angaria]
MWCDDVAEPDATWQIYSLAAGFALASLILIATVLDKKKNFEKNLEHDDDDSIFGAIAPSIALTYRKFAKFSKKSIITAFSLKSSLKFLQRNSSREIPILNGLKVFTTFWVIFSHTCLFSLNFSDVVADVLKEARNRPILSAFLLNSSLAVDTFLLISGIVAAYSLRRKWQFRGGTQQMTVIRSCTMLLHRLFRYLPSLTIYMVFMVYLYNRLGDGPFWNGAATARGISCQASVASGLVNKPATASSVLCQAAAT